MMGPLLRGLGSEVAVTMSIRGVCAGLWVAAPVVAFITAFSPAPAWADNTCPDGWSTIVNGQCVNPADSSSSACEAGLKLGPSGVCVPIGDNSSGQIPGYSSGGQPPLPADMLPQPDTYCGNPCVY